MWKVILMSNRSEVHVAHNYYSFFFGKVSNGLTQSAYELQIFLNFIKTQGLYLMYYGNRYSLLENSIHVTLIFTSAKPPYKY